MLLWGQWLFYPVSPAALCGAGAGNGVAVDELPRAQVEVQFNKQISLVRMALFLFLEYSD